ncbi:tRNA 2-selenouridine(34) synthase MnmH [Gimibacter soli]|uniref:tRNA 2-selenouridine synthase n=1 Tax=Gimibacter soli TaxID=3024400 RepID=A0AAE9XTZ0_9PROT|nr:tRNA 2-selenouridine(34) synthase MnmH [Gimibacter soli]WCL54846.1 tRNA 2-selenouridine(34) synthase MnmH [Gimibacter soli]
MKGRLSEDYRAIFMGDTPMIDLRSPGEFARGSFPHTVNLPLMTNEERAFVGTTYKQEGQAEAIKRGHALVSGAVKEARVAAWAAFARAHPNGFLFCWRGGLRSEITQGWLRDAGVDYRRVAGGYKALRRYLIDTGERICREADFVVVAGRTGTGKTHLLNSLAGSVDLEGLARHRGSSFGRWPGDQPSQIDFENRLSIALLRTEAAGSAVLIEDEGNRIGQRALPPALIARIQSAPLLVVEEPFEARVETILGDYVTDMLAEHVAYYGGEGFERFAAFLQDALARIAKRLGGLRYGEIAALMADALAHQRDTGDAALHRAWIERLLRDYYDPMYDYQLSQNARPVLMRGSRTEIAASSWQAGTGKR